MQLDTNPTPSPSPSRPRVRVVPTSALARSPKPGHGGFAHLCFEGVPPQAPGYLELGPLVLAALERMPGDSPGYRMHPHDNLELVTLVFEGALAHRDSLGQDERLGAGEVQAISAGHGIEHEEVPADGAPVMAMEILLRPRTRDAEPRRHRARFAERAAGAGLITYASGRAGAPASALPIDQDASVCGGRLRAGERVQHTLEPGRCAYLVSTRGAITVDGARQQARAAAQERVLVEGGGELSIRADADTELVLLDLP